MATPSEKLAESLEILKHIQDRGIIAIQPNHISRTHRERLIKNGFLKELIKGWYIPARQDETAGESTAWYASFWHFCSAYFNKRFSHQWCLSPEQSLSLHAGNWTIPQQLVVRTPKGSNKIINLPHRTSLLDIRYEIPDRKNIETLNGMHVFSLNAALVSCAPRFFIQNPTDTRTALALIQDVSGILHFLLSGGHSTIAGRLAGVFRHVGRDSIANEIIKTMAAAGFDVRENNVFEEMPSIHLTREKSPYVNRMNILWQEMRHSVIEHFPGPLGRRVSAQKYIKNIDAIYVTDAYHSLSIEGYRVSAELIQRVKKGVWDPDHNEDDKKHTAALAARGYWEAFTSVKKSVSKALDGENPGQIFHEDHRDWYRALFTPSVQAGVLKPTDLAGYRRDPVYIRCSMHVPPNPDAVRDLMPAFCELLSKETHAAVRIVLGHFFFVYIHPYMDGNGRIGRFLMNVMSASGGYPWIIVPVEQRNHYMKALEEASVRQNIKPFAQFLGRLVSVSIKK